VAHPTHEVHTFLVADGDIWPTDLLINVVLAAYPERDERGGMRLRVWVLRNRPEEPAGDPGV
jgi:hypothetical protein